MCTLVLLRRPDHDRYPLLLAANRDEMANRPSRAPGRHWEDRPEIVAGLDELGGGSWLGVNDHGVAAAVLNRQGTLGPEEGMRSRGELVLEALDHAEAGAAAEALAHLDPRAYRPFNLVVADAAEAYWLRHAGDGMVRSQGLGAGFAMLSAREVNDPASPRIRRYLPLFRAAEAPEPDKNDWSSWQLLLAATASETGDPMDAMQIVTSNGYGTRSSSLIALPPFAEQRPLWLYKGTEDDAWQSVGFD